MSNTGNGFLKLHDEQDFSKMSDETIKMFARADDGSLVFNTRADLMLGSKIACLVMDNQELTVHVGHDDKKYKTESMLFPSTKTLKKWRKVPIGIDIDRDEIVHQISKKKNKFVVNLNNKCDNAPETKRTIVDEKGGFFDFTKSSLVGIFVTRRPFLKNATKQRGISNVNKKYDKKVTKQDKAIVSQGKKT